MTHTTVLYTVIEPETKTVEQTIRDAQRLGFTLVTFAGWTDEQLSVKPPEYLANKQALAELLTALRVHDEYLSIYHVIARKQHVMEDDEAAAVLHAVDPSTRPTDV